MSPFLRIGFTRFEMDPGLEYHEEVLNPYCAVHMKEPVDTGQSSATPAAYWGPRFGILGHQVSPFVGECTDRS